MHSQKEHQTDLEMPIFVVGVKIQLFSWIIIKSKS